MAKPLSSGLHDQSATVRQLKLLIVVLVLSNIGLGLFSFFLLRAIDKQYSELIGKSVPVLNSLQTVTARAMEAMRTTNPNSVAAVEGRRGQQHQEASMALARDRDLRNEVLRAEWAGAAKEREEFKQTGEAFTKLATEVVAHLAAGRTNEAMQLREGRLRGAFDHYILAATKAADVLEADSERMNLSVSAKADNMSTLLLGIASWPIIVLIGLLLITALFVVVLMVLFRGREMSDTP